MAVTRTGNTTTTYLNGISTGTGNTFAIQTTNVPTNNNINLGSAYSALPGPTPFGWYGKNSISLMRMYNRALTSDEIRQNFNAHRGRYGL
jgi:hypothetical protein